jgi:hypothetical protein
MLSKLHAGKSGERRPAAAPDGRPRPSGPITTKRDLERNTYTSERSKKLREGNISQP